MSELLRLYELCKADLPEGSRAGVTVQLSAWIEGQVQVYITVAYLGENMTDATFGAVERFVASLKDIDLSAQVVGSDLAGPDSDIPILVVELSDDLRMYIAPLYHKYAVPSSRWQKRLWSVLGKRLEPEFHVTVKHSPKIASLPVGTKLAISGFCVKCGGISIYDTPL
jgi:hypothetical protein